MSAVSAALGAESEEGAHAEPSAGEPGVNPAGLLGSSGHPSGSGTTERGSDAGLVGVKCRLATPEELVGEFGFPRGCMVGRCRLTL